MTKIRKLSQFVSFFTVALWAAVPAKRALAAEAQPKNFIRRQIVDHYEPTTIARPIYRVIEIEAGRAQE